MNLLYLLPLLCSAAVSADKPADEPPVIAKVRAIVESKALEPRKGDDELQKLLKERCNTAVTVLRVRYDEYMAGRTVLPELIRAFGKVRDSQLDLTNKPEERIAILTLDVELGREAEKFAEAMFEAGKFSKAQLGEARLYRQEAAIRLLREQRKPDPSRR